MNAIPVLQTRMTVDEVLSQWPHSHPAFSSMKTNCIGCLLQKFCTLQDVAQTYHIPFEELIVELEKYIISIDDTQRSSK